MQQDHNSLLPPPTAASSSSTTTSPSRLWNHDEPSTQTGPANPSIVNEDVPSDYSDLISLHSLTLANSNNRVVSYSIAGDPNGTPILFWYAGGCNRRVLLLLQEAAELCQLRFVCLNRPGRGATSPANYELIAEEPNKPDGAAKEEFSIRVVMAEERDKEEATTSSSPSKNDKLLSTSHARIHMDTCLSDAIAVLDALQIDKVGQLYECAGAPFALCFAQHHSQRLLPHTPMIGIGSWIQPADCNDTKQLFQFGARKCPLWMIAPLISGSMGSLEKSASWVPASWIGKKFAKSLTEKEQDVLDANWEIPEFVERFRFMQLEGGGTVMADLTCLLSKSRDIGLDYSAIHSRVILVHAMDDSMAPLAAAQWLKEQLPNSRLIQVPNATHEGTLFLLHHEIEQSLKLLTKGEVMPVDDVKEVVGDLPVEPSAPAAMDSGSVVIEPEMESVDELSIEAVEPPPAPPMEPPPVPLMEPPPAPPVEPPPVPPMESPPTPPTEPPPIPPMEPPPVPPEESLLPTGVESQPSEPVSVTEDEKIFEQSYAGVEEPTLVDDHVDSVDDIVNDETLEPADNATQPESEMADKDEAATNDVVDETAFANKQVIQQELATADGMEELSIESPVSASDSNDGEAASEAAVADDSASPSEAATTIEDDTVLQEEEVS